MNQTLSVVDAHRDDIIPRFELTAEEAARLAAAFHSFPLPVRHAVPAWEAAALQAQAALPLPLRRVLREQVHGRAAAGCLLIRGLPVDVEPGPTPAPGEQPLAKTTTFSEAALLTIGSELGMVFGERSERSGSIPQQIVPDPARERALSSESSRGNLGLHTDNAGADVAPDFLLIQVVRPDPERIAATRVLDVRRLLQALPVEVVDTLFRREFEVQPPRSFRSSRWRAPRHIAVLSGHRSRPRVRLNDYAVRGLTSDGERALRTFFEAARDPRYLAEVRLRAGDQLVIDNAAVLHGRTPFTPHYDGTDRWLQRVYVASGPLALGGAGVPSSRVR